MISTSCLEILMISGQLVCYCVYSGARFLREQVQSLSGREKDIAEIKGAFCKVESEGGSK